MSVAWNAEYAGHDSGHDDERDLELAPWAEPGTLEAAMLADERRYLEAQQEAAERRHLQFWVGAAILIGCVVVSALFWWQASR